MLHNNIKQNDEQMTQFSRALKFRTKSAKRSIIQHNQQFNTAPFDTNQYIKPATAYVQYQQQQQYKYSTLCVESQRRKSRDHSLSIKKKLKKQIDMIIPSLEAFDFRSIELTELNKKQKQKQRRNSLRKQSLKITSRMMKSITQKDYIKVKQIAKPQKTQKKMLSTLTQFQIKWKRDPQFILQKSKQKYIYSERQKPHQFFIRRKNIQTIVRRKAHIGFSQMMTEYCQRMRIRENSKIFVFDSADNWMKETLIQKGWIMNADIESKLFHLKWSIKVPQKANKNQLVNHFYDSDMITSKQGLAKIIKKSKFLEKHFPRTYDLGQQIKQFIKDFKITQILCQLKLIILQIQKQNLIPQQALTIQQLKLKLKQLKQSQNYTSQQNTNNNLQLNIISIMKLLQFCQKLTNQLQKQKIILDNLIDEQLIQYLCKNKLIKNQYSPNINEQQNIQQMFPQQQNKFNQQIKFILKNANSYPSSYCYRKPSQKLLQIIYSYHKYFCKYLNTYQVEGSHNIWIVKNRNSARGIGIFLSNNICQITKRTQNKLVQKYIQNCALYKPILNSKKQYKYDLRVWVLVKSFNPLIAYFYQQFYCRLCSHHYNLYNINTLNRLQSHLTNYSTNKQSFQNDKKSSILTYQQFLQSFSNYNKVNQIYLKKQMNKKLQQLIYNTLIQYKNIISSQKQCFQLYGFDVLVSNTIQLFLLQVNLSPACQDRNQWLSKNVRKMAKGLIDIVSTNYDNNNNEKNKSSGEDQNQKGYNINTNQNLNNAEGWKLITNQYLLY